MTDTNALISTAPTTAGSNHSNHSLLRRIGRALVRFWDKGGASVDAIYSYKSDARHFVDTTGVSLQYHGTGTASASTLRVPASEAADSLTEGRLEKILESEGRFGGTIDTALSVYGARRKAG